MAELTLITTTTFSAAASTSIDNCFTSTYDHYMLTFRAVRDGAGNAGTELFLRAGGGDNLVANKVWIYWDAQSTSFAGNVFTQDNINVGPTDNFPQGVFTSYVFSPAISGTTTKVITKAGDRISGNARMLSLSGYAPSTAAFDGFSLVPTSSTITGQVWVYGFPKS